MLTFKFLKGTTFLSTFQLKLLKILTKMILRRQGFLNGKKLHQKQKKLKLLPVNALSEA